MGHQIMGKRFISRVQPAWHNIAQRIFPADTQMSAREAAVEVSGDVGFARSKLWAEIDGNRIEVKDQTAIFRKPTVDDDRHKFLGLATESWALDSYPDLAASLDDLPKNGYLVETAGVLNDGGLMFLCFRGEDWQVRGDEMRSYFAANFSMTPGQAHKIFHSPVRVVCWNTNQAADQSASINLSIPHSSDAKQRMELASRLVTQFVETKDKAKAIFEAFADKQVSTQDVAHIIAAAFEMPGLPSKLKLIKQQLSETEAESFKRALTPTLLLDLQKEQERYDRQIDLAVKLRETAMERFEAFNPENLRGTAWAAYNAVTEVADWREGRNADEGALFGSRAKEKSRAYAATLTLCN